MRIFALHCSRMPISSPHTIKNTLLATLLIMIVWGMSSCKKDIIDEDPGIQLSFSQDTVFFDTVFTSIGSVTKYLTVRNTSNSRVRISSINLAGGSSSFYQLNIDGEAANEATDLEIAANDSLFIFIRTTIDPTDVNSPFVVSDSILFLTNGNQQKVQLVAWGQNAHYILADTYIPGFPKFKIVAGENETVTWTGHKPYVIYGYAVVDSTGMLEITKGANIHFHNNGGLWVYKGGTLKVRGEADSVVTFQGDRLEPFYRDLPGQWDRIWLNESAQDHEINYAVIRNGFIGLQPETFSSQMGGKLILSNTIIENMTGFGILTRYFDMIAYNNVVTNCGQYLVALTWGGDYDIRHCTFANYWSQSVRVTPSFVLNNFFTDQDNNIYAFDFNAYFGNCILYGRNNEEMLYSFDEGASYDYFLESCLLQTEEDFTDPAHFANCLNDKDTIFLDYMNNDYSLDTLSAAIDKGNPQVLTGFPFDLQPDITRNNRELLLPDMGAYEFVKPE
jgi:hypothetical protein